MLGRKARTAPTPSLAEVLILPLAVSCSLQQASIFGGALPNTTPDMSFFLNFFADFSLAREIKNAVYPELEAREAEFRQTFGVKAEMRDA